MNEQPKFEEIREHRGAYFVEYQPPVADRPFAILNLVVSEAVETRQVAALMEGEARHWLQRYPVPLMIFAFDASDHQIRVRENADERYLTAWNDLATDEPVVSWKTEVFSAFLKSAPTLPDLRSVYSDVPFRTDAEVRASADRFVRERRNQNRFLKVLFLLWLAVLPAAWAIFEFLGPEWVGALILAYSLWKFFQEGQRVLRYRKPSKADEEKAKKELKMRHYFYHCERNPEGFLRLRSENFARDARAQAEAEAAQLAQGSRRSGKPNES